jgi:hypothetical protein
VQVCGGTDYDGIDIVAPEQLIRMFVNGYSSKPRSPSTGIFIGVGGGHQDGILQMA